MQDRPVKQFKTLVVAIIGVTLLVIGIAMIVLPGPAIVVIPAALGILATEFAWARRMLQTVREWIQRYGNYSK